MHWSILFTWLLLLAWTCSTAYGFFWIGWYNGRVSAEAILDTEISRIKREYNDRKAIDGYNADDSMKTAISTQTITECKGLI